MKAKNRKWTRAACARLVEKVDAGVDYETLRKEYGYKTRQGIIDRICKARLVMAESVRPRRRTAQRPCITCRKPFASEGPHHRMCAPCRVAASSDMGGDYV